MIVNRPSVTAPGFETEVRWTHAGTSCAPSKEG